jgi:hypothetical protein
MVIVCEFCNREYSSNSSLNLHKKTAKFCLEKQKQLKEQIENTNQETEIIVLKCNFCSKNFNMKTTLLQHLASCKFKKKKEQEILIESLKKNYEEEIKQLKKEKKDMKTKYENELKELNVMFENKLKEEKDKYEKDIYYLKTNIETLIKSQSVVSSQQQKSDNYNIQINNTVNNLIVYSPSELNTKIKQLITYYEKPNQFSIVNIHENLLTEIVKILQPMVQVKDPINQMITYLNEKGIYADITAEELVIDSFGHSRATLDKLINLAIKYVDLQYANNNCNVKQYNEVIGKLIQFRTDVGLHKSTPSSKSTAKLLVDKSQKEYLF